MKVYDPEVEALVGPPSGKDMAIGGAHEGASRINRELALWSPPLRSADADILPDKPVIDARVRDSIRNDGYVQNGKQLHQDHIVGSMFMLAAKPEIRVLGAGRKTFDEMWAQEFAEETEAKFTLWAESPNNWPDAARVNTLTAMVRLAVGVYAGGGEVLATAEWLRDNPRPYQTAIQMIELERLSNPPHLMNDTNVRGGIEFDRWGAPKFFHIQKAHPTDTYFDQEQFQWKRIAIRKEFGRLQVIHIVEQSRIDQSRGISQIVAALKEIKITKKFRDIVLQNAVVNATYAASIESELPPEAAFASLGGGNLGEGIANYGAAYLGAVGEYIGNSKNMHIDGVKIPHLFPGTKLQLRNASTAGGLGTNFEQSLLRYIAANLGVSYEQLSRDYSQTNYSSIRAGLGDVQKFMLARKRMVADRFASAIYRLWLEEALNKGDISTMPRNAPSWYEGMNADAYARCEWIGAGRGQIDELKETQAAVLRLKYHLSTYEEEMGRLGKDWRKVLQQRELEVKTLKERKLVVEESNQMNAASGAVRDKSAGKGDDPDADEEKEAA